MVATIRNYALGMSEFQRLNPVTGSFSERLGRAVRVTTDEMAEVLEAIRRPAEFLDELSDVLHSIVVSVFLMLPNPLHEMPFCWGLIFFLSGGRTAWKHGKRFGEYGCVRSLRHCGKDHVCLNRKLVKDVNIEQ